MSFEHLPEQGRSGHRSPRPQADAKHSSNKDINILLLGRKGSGKTALAVRFITKRFIGDYNSELEMLYSHSVSLDGKHVTLHIIDTLGQTSKDDVSEDKVLWADCVTVVYSITDKESFDVARDIMERVHNILDGTSVPVALVAAKTDLIERQKVSNTEVSRLCAEFNLFFFETSASEALSSVGDVFMALGRQVRHVHKKREKLTRFMSNPAVAAKLQIQQSLKNLAERTWRTRTSTL